LSIYTLPDLGYTFSDLEPHVSAEALELHHDKHHRAYVTGANSTLEDLGEARKANDYTMLNQLQKSLAFHVSGHVLHSMLWKVMSPDGGGRPGAELMQVIEKSFGSFDAMKSQMTQCALSLQGSGWASLAWEPLSQRLVIEQVHDHQGNIGNATLPVLVLDMWEHAYYLQYRNEKAKWVDAFWEIVDWADVANRLANVSKVELSVGG
jgi:Fe-Mn family superoxide dismutase